MLNNHVVMFTNHVVITEHLRVAAIAPKFHLFSVFQYLLDIFYVKLKIDV